MKCSWKIYLITLSIIFSFLPCVAALSGPEAKSLKDGRADEIWVEDITGCNGDTVDAVVWLYNGDSVIDTFGFDLTYDTDSLTFVRCTYGTLNPGWTIFDYDESTPGLIEVTGISPQYSIPPGCSGTFAILTFEVTCPACQNGDTSDLQLTSLWDDLTGFSVSSGTFQYQCPTPTPGPGDRIRLISAGGCLGDAIEVPVQVTNDYTAIDTFSFRVTYDTAMLDYTACARGTLDPGWDSFDCTETEPGNLTISGSTAGMPVPAGSDGTLVILSFDVTCTTCQNGDTSDLNLLELTGDLTGFVATSGQFRYACSTPTPVPDDDMWVEDTSGCLGDFIEIEVWVSSQGTDIDVFQFVLGFDTDMLEFYNCLPGVLDPEWAGLDCDEITDGEITASGMADLTGIAAGSTGSLVRLVFSVICDPCDDGDMSDLVLSNLLYDLTDFNTYNGTFTYDCTEPTATPTDTPSESPTPTYTPQPSSTPTYPAQPHINIYMNKATPIYGPGDRFIVHGQIHTPDFIHARAAVLMDVYGLYFWWPDWSSEFQNTRHLINFDQQPGLYYLKFENQQPGFDFEFKSLMDFVWPSVDSQAENLRFWIALLKQDVLELYNNESFDWTDFSYQKNESSPPPTYTPVFTPTPGSTPAPTWTPTPQGPILQVQFEDDDSQCSPDPELYCFGNTMIGSRKGPYRVAYVRNVGTGTLSVNISITGFDNDHFEIKDAGLTEHFDIPSGENRKLLVYFAPDAPPDVREASILFDGGSGQLVQMDVRGRGVY